VETGTKEGKRSINPGTKLAVRQGFEPTSGAPKACRGAPEDGANRQLSEAKVGGEAGIRILRNAFLSW